MATAKNYGRNMSVFRIIDLPKGILTVYRFYYIVISQDTDLFTASTEEISRR